jgi:hypothetical protein
MRTTSTPFENSICLLGVEGTAVANASGRAGLQLLDHHQYFTGPWIGAASRAAGLQVPARRGGYSVTMLPRMHRSIVYMAESKVKLGAK